MSTKRAERDKAETARIKLFEQFPTYRTWHRQTQKRFRDAIRACTPTDADLEWVKSLPWAQSCEDGTVKLHMNGGRCSALLYRFAQNRCPALRDVLAYAADMEQGLWRLTGAGMSATHTHMLDGEHRLWAGMHSGVEFDIYICFGCKESSREIMDTNVARTGSQAIQLVMGCKPTPSRLMDRISRRYRLLTGLYTPKYRPHMSVSFSRRFKPELAWILGVAEGAESARIRNPAVFAALILAYKACPREASIFARNFVAGTGKEGSPVQVFRNSRPIMDGKLPDGARKDCVELLTLLALKCQIKREPLTITYNGTTLSKARDFFMEKVLRGTPPTTAPTWIPLHEAAKLANTHASYLRQVSQQGKIRSERRDGENVYCREDVVTWAKERRGPRDPHAEWRKDAA
jgi:hypothetical protein